MFKDIVIKLPRKLIQGHKLKRLFNKCNFKGNLKVKDFKNLDFLVLQAPAWGIETPPLSLAVLNSIARKNTFRSSAIDLNVEFYHKRKKEFENIWNIEVSTWFWFSKSHIKRFLDAHKEDVENIVNLIVEANPKCIGFSIYQSSFDCSLLLADLIKERAPDIKIIFGGPHVSKNLAGIHALEVSSAIDLIVEGEGETTLIEILENIKKDKSIFNIPGTFYKSNDKVIINEPRSPIRNLDELPFADFTQFNFNNYTHGHKLPIMSSRGCPNKCIYCTEMVYWNTYRSFSAERVFSEIQYQFKKYNHLNFVEFQDSLINGNLRHLEKLTELIFKNGMKFKWAAQAVIRREMDFLFFKKLQLSGCVCLAFGMETTSIELMKLAGKNLARMTNLENLVKSAHKAGLSCVYNFMFGLPRETEEHHQYTLNFIKKNAKYIDWVNPSPAFCGFSNGTAGGDRPEDYDMEPDKSGNNYWVSKDGSNNFLVRLRRFEEFCSLIYDLKIKSTYPSPKLLNRDKVLGDYYHFHKDFKQAKSYFKRWIEDNPSDTISIQKLNECESKQTA